MSKDSQEEREFRGNDSREADTQREKLGLIALLEEGERLLAEKDYQEAARALDKVVEADPLNLDALLAWSRAKARSGKLSDAETALRQVIESVPGHADALYELAVLVEAEGNKGEAIELLRRSLAAASGNPEGYLALGRLLWSDGDEAGGLASFEAAVALDPANAKAQYNTGLARRTLGDREAAAHNLRRAAELEPENADFLSALAYVLVFQERYQETAEVCGRIVALAPDSVPARIYAGIAAAKLGTPERAESLFNEAISLDPTNTEAYCRLALLYQSEDRMEEAVKTAQEACDIASGEAFPLLLLGQVCSEAAQPERAEQALWKYVRVESRDVHGWLQLSGVLSELGRNEEAERALDKARLEVPSTAKSMLCLGQAYEDLQSTSKARECFREAVELDPQNRDTRFKVADLLAHRLDHKEAAKVLTPIVRPDYSDVDAVVKYVGNLDLSGAGRRAKRELRRALRKSPEEARLWLRLGKMLVAEDPGWPEKLSRKFKAFEALKKAVQLDPSLLEARLELGEALTLAGRLDQAKDAYDKAVMDFPESPLSSERLGVFLLRHGDPETAVSALDKVVQLSGKETKSEYELVIRLLLLAEAQDECGQYAETDETIARVLEIDAGSGAALRLRGRSKLKRGDRAGALKDLKQAVERNEQDYEARALLGTAQLEKNRDDALRHFESALTQGPSDPGVQCALAAAVREGVSSAEVLSEMSSPPKLFFRLPTDHWGHLENASVFKSEVLPDGARGFTKVLLKKLKELNQATLSAALEFRNVSLFLLSQHLARFVWNRRAKRAILRFVQAGPQLVTAAVEEQSARVHRLFAELRREGMSAGRYCHLRAKWLEFLTFRESKANPWEVEVDEFHGDLSIDEAQRIWVGQRLVLAWRYAVGFLVFVAFMLVPPILMSLPSQWLGLDPVHLTTGWAVVVVPLFVVVAAVIATKRGVWIGLPVLAGLGVGEWVLFSALPRWHSLVDSEFYRLLLGPASFQLAAVLGLAGILANWKASRRLAAPVVGLAVALLAALGFVRLLEARNQFASEWLPILVIVLVGIDLIGTVVWKQYGLVRNPYVFQNPMAPATWVARVVVDGAILLGMTLVTITGSWGSVRASMLVEAILGSPLFERAAVICSIGVLGVSILSVARFAIRPVVLIDGLLEYGVDFWRRSLESAWQLAEESSRTERFPALPRDVSVEEADMVIRRCAPEG